MSNLTGSYKVGVGEAQSADLREQERRARLMLLDGIREPSPQPIFGEPVKVENLDETSRRIKKTLGDVNEVLTNDAKTLIGISRSNPTSGYPMNGHQGPGHPQNSHPMSGHPSNSHSMPGHSNSHLILSGNPSNSHPMSGMSSNSHSMSGHLNSHPMTGHSNSHLLSGRQANTQPMPGHQSTTHPFTGHPQMNAHSMIGHQPNTHPMTGHPANTHPLTGHPSSSHPISGHPSYNPTISGHPSNSHLISRHTSSSHSIPGHPPNSHSLTGRTSNSHLINGHPSNIHAIPGHATSGHPSNNYHMTGQQASVHSIPGHPLSSSTATVYSGAGHVNAAFRPQAAAKKVPVPANNVTKPLTPNISNVYNKLEAEKRQNNFNRQKPDSPITQKLFTPFSCVENTQQQVVQPNYHNQDARAWNTDQKKAPYPVNIHFSGGNYNTVSSSDINMQSSTTTTCAPIWSCGPETPAIQMAPFHLPPCVTPSTANKPVYNIPGQSGMVSNMQTVPKVDNSMKRPLLRPSLLKIERKPTSTIGVETILKEMTKPVPAPLTAIQTPRTEETGFAFPPEPKEEPPVAKIEEKVILTIPSDESKPALVSKPQPIPFTSSLQDDLEMSESDEEVVPEIKKDPSEYLKSPSSNPVIPNTTPPPVPVTSTTTTNMENNSGSSSSSESGDSDSDDDSSESNNSDSSSESSDEDTSSMKWGLSNFVDESRRNHSPAFRNLEMQKQLNSVKTLNGICPPIISPPVSTPLSDFIVADTPVTAKSEIISPIRSPAHPVIGPRTPPSPICPTKDISDGNEANITSDDVKPDSAIELKSPDNALDFPNDTNTVSENVTPVTNEDSKEKAAVDTSSDVISSETGSSPITHSCNDDVTESKENLNNNSEKDSSPTETKSSLISSDAVESSQENSSSTQLKTRIKITVPVKKKSATSKKANSNISDASSSPPIAKFKHPRACRKSNEKLVSTEKSEPAKEPKKRLKPPLKQKESLSLEKTKSPVKAANSAKKPANKSPIKPKAKITKATKTNSEAKKTDIKNKKKKFVVANFLQSPSPATTENPSDLQPSISGSEKNSTVESKKQQDSIEKSSSSTPAVSKTPAKNNAKPNNGKSGEKLRRSARCSERASSLNQAETPSSPKSTNDQPQNPAQTETASSTGKNKKPTKKSLKSKSQVESLPLSIEPPLQILSPIPHDSPAIASTNEPGDRKKIMVSIPLSKLFRIPSVLQQIQEPDSRVLPKNPSANLPDDAKVKTAEKSVKTASIKGSQSKDFKDKPRTIQTKKNTKKNTPTDKKENASKPFSETASKTTTTVNKNNSKTLDKPVCDVENNKLPKKRKSEDESKLGSKKKPKLSLRSAEEKKSKEQTTATKTDSVASQNDAGLKPKPLERCDSASSLNSLGSQRSSKSSKEKKDTVIHESKRLKTSTSSAIPVKDIKQEKEDRSKVQVKKEPSSTLDKGSKSRDKSAITDIDCKEKGDSWSDSLNSSSQYCLWDDVCKDDSKAENLDNLSRDSTFNWDHFSLDKDMKEASALKMLTDQGPIMPMDYYWTEGRKMKKMAELEKDPFQQAVKFFEAAVLYVLTSQQKEENSKNPDAVYQFYYETLSFTTMMLSKIKKLQSCPGSTEFKLLILCLKCQSLLNVKLYSLKIKEIKEQLEGVSDFFRSHCSTLLDAPNPNLPSLHQSRISSLSTVSSPHSVIPPSPNSVSSQTSGYASGESGNLLRNTVCVPQNVLDTIYRQHTHFKNLHMGHDLWEQADMYMTRSNLKEFFKEVADQSEPLTLHSTIKELVSYMQKGIGLVKNYLR